MEAVEKCVLAVRDDELDVGNDELGVGDDEDTSSEAAEGRGTRGRTLKVVVPTRHGEPAPGVRAAGDSLGTACAIKFNNYTFYGYIRILLIKTNSMIYICYIKYGGNGGKCVIAVGDDELDVGNNELGVGDDEDASSEAAEG